MKKIILAMALTSVLFSCSKSPENQAQSNISEYLKANMDDPSSYESVEFEKLDTLHTSFNESKKGMQLIADESRLALGMTKLDIKLDNDDLSMSDIENIKKESSEITKKRIAINDTRTSETIKYKGAISGYSMVHKFRGKNKLGAKILDEIRFLLDTKLVVQGEAQ